MGRREPESLAELGSENVSGLPSAEAEKLRCLLRKTTLNGHTGGYVELEMRAVSLVVFLKVFRFKASMAHRRRGGRRSVCAASGALQMSKLASLPVTPSAKPET